MALWAVLDCYPLHCNVQTAIEPQGLLESINRNEVNNVSGEGYFGHFATSWILKIIGQVGDKKMLIVATTRLTVRKVIMFMWK